MPETVAFICVRFEAREGTFYASSEELPGLHLCGTSLSDVQKDVCPMIEKMYELNFGLKVRALPAADAQSFELPSEAANADHMRVWATPVREAIAA